MIDLWEVPDANAIAVAMADPELARFAPRLSQCIEDESLVVLTKLPVG